MKLDKRYKVNQAIVLEIINLRSLGWSFKNIATKFNISVSTAWYWACAAYREKQRETNRKRSANTPEDKARARAHAKARYYKKEKEDHLRDRIKRSIREGNYLVYGKKRSYWQQNFPHLFENIPNAKLDGIL